jgi:uncharacterized phiE125 gp8 family phage protein
MLAPILITAPASPPITLEMAKQHLRVSDSEEDVLIQAYIEAATAHLDGWSGILGRALVTQTWRQDFASFSPALPLPLHPAQTITSVTYIDAAGDQQTVPAADYDLVADSMGGSVMLKPGRAWPATGQALRPVSVTYVAGLPAAEVPAPIRSAILLMVGDLYANRETTASSAARIPMAATVEALIAPWRRGGV